MITFRTPELKDKPWVDTLLSFSDFQGCEYTFANLFLWSGLYQTQIARYQDYLLVKFDGGAGLRYLYPAGKGDIAKALDCLKEDAQAHNAPFRMLGLTETAKCQLEEAFPGQYVFESDQVYYDYLYQIDRLADLPGKSLHNKRTHINRFIEQHPDWHFEVLRPEYVEECWAIDMAWSQASNHSWADDLGSEEAKQETGALRRALDHREELGLEGGVLFAGGKAIAFTLGGRLNSNTFDVHFEKAYAEIQGAYTMINREFIRMIREEYPEIEYINREDDLGLPGLRQAKRSYKPDGMVVKYGATQKTAANGEHIFAISKNMEERGAIHVCHPSAACL